MSAPEHAWRTTFADRCGTIELCDRCGVLVGTKNGVRTVVSPGTGGARVRGELPPCVPDWEVRRRAREVMARRRAKAAPDAHRARIPSRYP